ncbi:hypothetical protein AURDEDRAFT_175729 [Auricularia subglabra TFB-10046 SS5]|uniref:Uncharacterized protein n=1 Tax=Auricularia subglabra (strain TFB-10046 / SS5) TaxID=717982 RepID=J0CX14_AURST|nr:hypothetical protein AURDEDRAFT_175729 [Auricularia subglabra TFB-10046 SS5]
MSLGVSFIYCVERLPAGHPVQRLELQGKTDGAAFRQISWADLTGLLLSEVQTLVLHHYPLSVLFAACESGWCAETLEIDYADDVRATLVHGARRCEMRGLASPVATGYHWNVRRLLFHRACLRGLVSFATSIPRLESIRRLSGLLPHIVLPNLTTFTLLCGKPSCNRALQKEMWDSLLTQPLLGQAGLLRAPQLQCIRLQARVLHCAEEDTVISPSALVRFITEHVQLQDGQRPPELRVDGPTVQFFDEPDALTVLSGLVESIQYKL